MTSGAKADPLLPATPMSSFPFARLASVTSSSTTFLYHQINGTTFAEEQWDELGYAWGATEYISVPDLSVQPLPKIPNPEGTKL